MSISASFCAGFERLVVRRVIPAFCTQTLTLTLTLTQTLTFKWLVVQCVTPSPHPHLNPKLQLVGGAAWSGLPLSAMVTHAWPKATPNRNPTPTRKPKPTPKPGPNLRLGGGAA